MEPQKMEKWGTKLTIKFLKKYREHRCLWDFNDPEYKNRIARTNALEDICETMAINNFDVRSANVKIKALRSTYLHEKRKIRKSSKTGVSYRPKLAWYPLADSFLRNYVMEKFCLMGAMSNENDGGQSQLQQQQQQGQINEMTIKLNEDNIQNDKQNFTEPQPLSSNTTGIGIGTGTNQQRSKQNNSANLKMTRSQIQQHHQQQQQQQQQPFNIGQGHGQSQTQIIPLGSMLPSIQPMTNNNNNNNNNNKEKQHSSSQHHLHHNDGITNFNDVAENCHQNLITYPHPSSASSLVHNRHKDFDEFDAFGNSIAAQMRTLPLDIAYEVQLQIQCLITQTKLKVLGRQTSIIVESNNNNNNNNNNNSNNNIPSSSSLSSARNWNQTSNNMNNSNVNNYSHSNACNQDVKMEGDDDGNNIVIDNNQHHQHHQHQHTNNTLDNHHNQHQIQNNDTSNTNCFGNIPSDGLQDPETSDVEDYLGLE